MVVLTLNIRRVALWNLSAGPHKTGWKLNNALQPKNENYSQKSWIPGCVRSCSTLKVSHQSSNAAETQYNWLCAAEIYSHFLVRDLSVRQWLCVFPMVSMSHKDTLLEKCSLLVASWLGKTPIMRGSLVGGIPTCLVASRFFFPFSSQFCDIEILVNLL
jgi:hypothetical protein